MNKFKIIIILILIMFVSGCKVRSNITVLADGTVEEKVIITEKKEGDTTSKVNYSKYIDGELDNYKALINYGNYNYEKIDNTESYGAEIYKKYNSICSYFQDTLFNQYIYRHIDCDEGDSFIVIANDTPFLEKNDIKDYSNPIDFDDIQLSITLPFNAFEHNADQVKDNTYIWKFDNNSKNKNIMLKINKNDLTEAKLNLEKQKEKENVIDIIKKGMVILIILVSIIYVVIVSYKKYKENKLEY